MRAARRPHPTRGLVADATSERSDHRPSAFTSLAPVAQAAAAEPVPTAPESTKLLVAHPADIDFKTERVGTTSYKRTKITNTGETTVELVVTGGLPDDFGFGLLPGETCPVLGTGEPFEAGASCYAVVRFSPTAGFVGFLAQGSLTATARDLSTGAVVAELVIPVRGEAVL
jgi:hypothetical protein